MEGEEKSQTVAESSPLKAASATKKADDGLISKCDTHKSNNESSNDKCPEPSRAGTLASDKVNASKEGEESLAETSSESRNVPKTETELAVQTLPDKKGPENVSGLDSTEKADTSSETTSALLTETGSKEYTKPKSPSDSKSLGAQIGSQSVSADPIETSNVSDGKVQEKDKEIIPHVQEKDLEPLEEAEVGSCKENQSSATGILRGKDNIRSTENSSKSQSEASSERESATVDDSSNMSSEAGLSLAHADPDQVNIDEPMDTTPACEERDPFSCSKDTDTHDTEVDADSDSVLVPVQPQTEDSEPSSCSKGKEKHDEAMDVDPESVTDVALSLKNASARKDDASCSKDNEKQDNTSMEVDAEPCPVTLAATPSGDVSASKNSDPFSGLSNTEKPENASIGVDAEPDSESHLVQSKKDALVGASGSGSSKKSSIDATTTQVDNMVTIEEEPCAENLREKEDSINAATDLDGRMEVDASFARSERNNSIVSDELDNESVNDDNSNDKQTSSDKGTASPEPDQTIIGDKMGEEVCIVPDSTSANANTSQTAEKDMLKEVTNASADQGRIAESQSGTLSDSQKDSSATERKTSEQEGGESSKIDDHHKTDVGAPDKSLDISKPKVGIHLVSTSSLVSRQDSADKATGNDVLETSQAIDINDQTEEESCTECGKMTKCKYKIPKPIGFIYLCEDDCYTKYRKQVGLPCPRKDRPRNMDQTYQHKCGNCAKIVDVKHEKSLSWETMDFCDEGCLEQCQRTHGSNCANCKARVKSASLGKYCVRFGYDMKQFCSAPCLEDFKKGLKVCSYCQKDISRGDGFLAPVGDKGAFKDFCTQECMEKYEQMSSNTAPPEVTHECAVCNEVKSVKVEVLLDSKLHKFCSDPCFAAFTYVNNIVADKCDMCKKFYDRGRSEDFSVFYDDAPHSFCCKTCMNVYILAKRKIVPCSWCKVKKYNFDMIKKVSSGQNAPITMCSLHCLEQYKASPTAAASSKPASQRKIGPKKAGSVSVLSTENEKSATKSHSMPVISAVTSLAPSAGSTAQPPPASLEPPAILVPPAPVTTSATSGTSKAPITSASSKNTSSDKVKTIYKQQFILRPPPHPDMSNCAVQVKPLTSTKSVSCRPKLCDVETQTDDSLPILIPVPVPIYIPMPMHMYSVPYPVPVPIPLPIPVPFFIPTTKNSTKGILQEIKRIHDNVPSDPYEAELLMMAEMVADKKAENTETDSEDGGNDADDGNVNDAESKSEPDFSPEHHQDTIGDDVLQMALKMASDFEPAADFKGSGAPTSITQSRPSRSIEAKNESDGENIEADRSTRSGRKAVKRCSSRSSSVSSKRIRTQSASDQQSSQPTTFIQEELVENPDANMCLKFTLGVNAWKSWVIKKNAELEKSKSNKVKTFKTELLKLSSDELNYSLCLFVSEAQDQNGCHYTADTMYYLCLGIQQYLMENGRADNIFCDQYYEKFTDCLDEAVKKFSPLQNNSQFMVTRIQEEHLWESKQLGAHNPYVLLNTLMYFNTKHFNLMTVEEHMQLSFSHIMKHWKRNATSPCSKSLGIKSNNVLLRFYPPQAALAADSKKKKVYEQQENEDNPLRCPVKLYEFYLSKCPESVKTRNDVFYLVPERSCVPDSPVWYSTMSLGHDHLRRMLHRIKVVKEIVDI